ncbi:MAG: helix-turn-helix domain-containing protein [Saprospiraceae bacterium]
MTKTDSLEELQIPKKSIAVLPFVNMSPDPENEYFSDGITEEIINSVTRVPGLKVIARTSSFAFKGNEDIPTIGKKLGVATVLEGSVRRAGNRLRISAKLVQCKGGFQIWAKSYDRQMDDIFSIQDEISLLIADQIRENFGHLEIQDHLSSIPTENVEAYNLYLKARFNHLKWNREGITTGIQLYQEAIAMDPGFSLPYFGIGFAMAMRASFGSDKELARLSEEYLSKGFELDPNNYLGYFGKATLSFWTHWNFKEGAEFYKKSIELNPSFTEAEEGLAELYTAIGEFDLALKHCDNILRLNPLSPNHYYTKGVAHYLKKEYQTAFECMEAGLKVDPNFAFCIERAILCLIQMKDLNGLKSFILKYPQAQKPQEALALFKLLHPELELEINLAEIDQKILSQQGPTLLAWELTLLVHLGHHQMALDTLETDLKLKRGQVINFKYMPLLEPLHQYPRFQKLVKKVFPPKNIPAFSELAQEIPSGNQAFFTEDQAKSYIETMCKMLEEEKLFLDPSLSLKELAEKLELHPNRLSFLINEYLEKNFNEFINQYRLNNFKIIALNPDNQHLTLLGLAYESGFNSKSVFNSFFKKMEGKTPRKWLKDKQ